MIRLIPHFSERTRSALMRSAGVAVVAAFMLQPALHAQAANVSTPKAEAKQAPPPVHLTSEQDHARTMALLHIKSIRPGVSGNPGLPDSANYDEATANIYGPMPNPLVMNDGRKVTSAEMWWKQRRPQIIQMFNEDIYGRVPAHVPAVDWVVASVTRAKNGDVPVITKHLVGRVDNSSYPQIAVNIELTLTTPANAKGPVPVIMELDIDPATMAALMKRFPVFRELTKPNGPTWQQQALARGWGYASYIPNSVQADNGAGLTEGIIGLVNKGQPRGVDDWGVLRAWAWGASRALDYFETDPAVNAKEVAIAGHSRYGKASLVAMAYDRRFSSGYISSSGEAGAKPYRRNWGEMVGNIAGTGEYHWMAGNFLKYDGPLGIKNIPVDANELIALCAPRPVFISGGSTAHGDGWVDARGMFMAAAAASPVYTLLGKEGLQTTVFPPIQTPLLKGTIAFRQHNEGHTPVPNWPYFMKFVSRYWSRTPAS